MNTVRRTSFLEQLEALMETPGACALCGTAQPVNLVQTDEVRVVLCSRCSLGYLSPRLTKEGYAQWYKEYFQDTRRGISSEAEAVARLERKGSYRQKEALVPFFSSAVNSASRCLEIGAGWGTMAKVLSDTFSCSMTVVEPSHLAATVAREHYGLDVFEGDFEGYLSSHGRGETFTVVVLFHVFEHLLEPNDFLERVKSTLVPGGALVLALPDLTNPDEPSEKYFHIEHCFYYTPRTLTLLLQKHGFRVEKLQRDRADMKIVARFNPSLPPPQDYKNDEHATILRALAHRDRVQRALRAARIVTQEICGEKVVGKVRGAVAALLRAAHIINV